MVKSVMSPVPPAVVEAAGSLYRDLLAAGIETVLDDRGLRPGPMLADMELIGIPHRLVVSDRGVESGDIEYKHRSKPDNEMIKLADAVQFLRSLVKS